MNKYELALVLNPTLDEEARTEAFNKVQDLITCLLYTSRRKRFLDGIVFKNIAY